MEPKLKDPVRSVNQEFLNGLEVVSNKVYPLPGAVLRGGDRDKRFTHLPDGTAQAVVFNHVATIRHRGSGAFFVAFRETKDAIYLQQQDPIKHPQWLMESQMKEAELRTFIHIVKPPYDKNPSTVVRDTRITDVTGQTRTHLWLDEIQTQWVFDTVAYFLLKNNVITQDMYGKLR